MKKMVYVVTAFFANFDESGYNEPSERFCADTWEEAKALQEKLAENPEYDEVIVSDDREEVDFYRTSESPAEPEPPRKKKSKAC